jgi:hypothetical protein
MREGGEAGRRTAEAHPERQRRASSQSVRHSPAHLATLGHDVKVGTVKSSQFFLVFGGTVPPTFAVMSRRAGDRVGGRTSMISRETLAAIGVAVAISGSLSGCAGRVRLSSKTMCEAHGGSYSTQTKQCSYPAQQPPRSALQICQMQGGQWDEVSDACAIDDRSR